MSEMVFGGRGLHTLVDLGSRGAGVAFLLGVFGQQRVLVIVSNVGLGNGDGQDAAEVGQPLLVETLDHARQVGDALQLDHLLQTDTVTEMIPCCQYKDLETNDVNS